MLNEELYKSPAWMWIVENVQITRAVQNYKSFGMERSKYISTLYIAVCSEFLYNEDQVPIEELFIHRVHKLFSFHNRIKAAKLLFQ